MADSRSYRAAGVGLADILGLVLLALLPATAWSGGPVHGAKAAAMGTAFIAVADDPSAIAYNPAGLALSRMPGLYGGGSLVIPSTDYRAPSGQSETTDFQVFPVPHLHVLSRHQTADRKDWTFGVGIFSPFGIGGRTWDEAGLTRYASTENLIATVVVNPTFALRLAPSLAVGFGIDYMLARSQTRTQFDQSALGGSDGEIAVKGDGDGWGYNLGLLFIPDERWRLGFAYRSQIRMRLDGDMSLRGAAAPLQPLLGGDKFNTEASTAMTFPDIVGIGIAYQPSPRMTLSFDAEQVRWSSFQNLPMDLRQEIPQAALTDRSTPFEWKDIWTLKAGMEYRMNERFALRAGYAYIPSAVPENTLSPAAPDSNLHHLSLGCGWKTADGLVLDLFYMAGFGKRRQVDNAILNGEYGNSTHYLGVSAFYPF